MARPFLKRLLLIFTGLFIVLAVAVWVFFAFYFDDVFNSIASEKLISAVSSATHGEYQLSLKRVSYSHGVVTAKGFELTRIGYRTGESGLAVRRVSIDSVQQSGVSLWQLICGLPLTFADLRVNDPRVYAGWIDPQQWHLKQLPPFVASKAASSTSGFSLDSAIFANIRLFRSSGGADSLAGIADVRASTIRLDSKATIPFTLGPVVISIPRLDFPDSSESRVLHVRTLAVRSRDSLLSADTIAYAATAHLDSGAKELSSTDFQITGIRTEGTNFGRLISGKGLALRSLAAKTWNVDFRSSHPVVRDTSAPNLLSQNSILKAVRIPVEIGSVDLPNGTLHTYSAKGLSLLIHDMSLRLNGLILDSTRPNKRPLFSDEVVIDVPQFDLENKSGPLKLDGIHGDTKNEVLSAKSVSYTAGGLDYRLAGMKANGIDYTNLFQGEGIHLKSLESDSWGINGRMHSSPSKTPAKGTHFSQDEIARSIPFPITLARLHLPKGNVLIRSASGSDATRANAAQVDLYDFKYDPKAPSTRPLFSGQVKLEAPHLSSGGAKASVVLVNLQGDIDRGLVTANAIDIPNGAMDYKLNGLRIEGIDFVRLCEGRGISLNEFKTTSWAVERHAVKADTQAITPKKSGGYGNFAKSVPFPIHVGHADMPEGTITLVSVAVDTGAKVSALVIKDVSVAVTEFNIDPKSLENQPALFSKQVTFHIPTVSYDESNRFYSLEMRNMQGNLQDSLVTIDSLGWIAKYSEDEFAAKHKYARARTEFRCADIRGEGVNFSGLLTGSGIRVREVAAPVWSIDYYKDQRKQANPHIVPAQLPNDLVRVVKLPITVSTINVTNGNIRFRERIAGASDAGLLTFDHVNVAATPFTTDSVNPLYHTPTKFDLSAVFIGESHLAAQGSYAMTDSVLNFSINGQVGGFNANRLNSHLVSNERVEIKKGVLDTGVITLNTVNGTATTTVTPIYHELALKVLPSDPKDPADLKEGAETFIADNFILRRDNPDDKGEKPVSATTTLTRKNEQEFFQFIWLALRQSIGTVIGGFK